MVERESNQPSKWFEEKIKPFGKRIAFPLASSILAVAAACADGEGKQIPTKTPTFTPEPVATATATPDKGVLIDRKDLEIPGFSIETYRVEYEDITNLLPESYRVETFELIKESLRERDPNDLVYVPSGICTRVRSVLDDFVFKYGTQYKSPDYIPGEQVDSVRLYVDDQDRRFFKGLDEKDDIIILDWQDLYYSPFGEVSVASDGKVVYYISGHDKLGESEEVVIIADIANSTKTVIRDSLSRSFSTKISQDGSTLAINFGSNSQETRGLYLLDMDTWRVRFYNEDFGNFVFMNQDGRKIYIAQGGKEFHDSFIYDTVRDQTTKVNWPAWISEFQLESGYFAAASCDLRYLVHSIPVERITEDLRTQNFGMKVFTPEGFFIILPPKLSYITFDPVKVDPDGTIYTTTGQVFMLQDGTYRLKGQDYRGSEVEIYKVRPPIR